MNTEAEAVSRGVALLNERLPGWKKLVDADSLNLASDCGCVLGQVLGSYYKGAELLGLSQAERIEYGFWPRRAAWKRLTQAWRGAIG